MPRPFTREQARQFVARIRALPRFRPKVGLGTRMAIVVVVATVVVVSLFAYLGTTTLNESTTRTLHERVILAQATASHIDYLLSSVENALTDFADPQNWTGDSPSATVEHIYGHLDFYASRLFLLDREKHLVAAYPPISSAIPYDQFNCVSEALGGKSFAIAPNTRYIGAQPGPVAATPLRDLNGNIKGVLLVAIDLNSPNLPTFSNPIGLGRTGYMDLIDSTGQILASTRPERAGEESDHGESLTGMIRDHRQSVSACHDCHETSTPVTPEREVLAFAPLDRAPWGVAVRQSEDEVFADTRLLQTRIFGLMLFCIAGALVLVYWGTRSIVSPLRALDSATKRIASGDLSTPVAIKGHDEIGALAQSFDAMRARLNDSMEEIHALNRDLDARAQERTAALEKALAENATLYSELQEKERLRGDLLHRVISAQEEERRRIARELHDETCQLLTGVGYALENAEADAPPDLEPELEKVRSLTDSALDGIHRMISDLRPSMLDHLGLVAALRWYAEQRFGGTNIQFTLHEIGDAPRLPAMSETALFRVAQEAINNIAQHSGAAHAVIVLQFADDCVEARIADDGDGFDPGQNARHGLGLMSMEERMAAIGGIFRLRSRPGQGTVIRLRVPIAR